MAEEKTEKKTKEAPKVENVQQKAGKEVPKTDAAKVEEKKSAAVEERVMTINIRKQLVGSPSWKRTKDAVAILRNMIERKAKSKVVLDKKLNEELWSKGIKNPQTKWRVKIVKDGEATRAELME